MRQFVKCDYCDSPIYFGQDTYQLDGCAGCYCSPECYAADHAKIVTMDQDEAENCFKEVFTEEDESDMSEKKYKDVTLIVDGKEYSVSFTDEEIRKMIPQNPYEKGSIDEDFYVIDKFGEVLEMSACVDALYNNGNYYKCKNTACDDARADKLMRLMRRAAFNSREEIKHIGDPDPSLWVHIVYDSVRDKLDVKTLSCKNTVFGIIRFGDVHSASSFAKEYKDDLLWYFKEYLSR